MDIQDVYRSIINRKAVLITGSGANVGVVNTEDRDFPSGSDLSKELYQLAGITHPENEYDLQDASETYIEKNGVEKIIGELNRRLRVKSISETQYKLYNNYWQRIYTTNYDEVPQIATESSQRPIEPIVLSDDYRIDRISKNLCIYINGYIRRLNSKTINNEFKLTGKSYLASEELKNSQWGALFSEDLQTSEFVVVVGLSLEYDLDIKRFVVSEGSTRKIVFIENNKISSDKYRKLERLGHVFCIGVHSFVQDLSEYSMTHEVEIEDTYTYKCFEYYRDRTGLKKPTSLEINRLFVFGDYQDDNLWFRDQGKYTGVIYRKKLHEAINYLESKAKVIYVHANLGNGKTLFIECLKHQLQNKSYKVFTLEELYDSLIAGEVKRIVGEKGRKLVVIENYFNYISVIKKFSLYDLTDVQFVLTARSVLFESRIVEVNDMLGLTEGCSYEIDINKLGKNEINQLLTILNQNGFWGDKSNKTDSEKRKLLTAKKFGNCELQSILYEVMQSEDIRSRFDGLVQNIKKMSISYYNALVLALLVKTMSLNISANDIGAILNIDTAFDASFKNDSNVKEVLAFSDGRMTYNIRSAITTKLILQGLNAQEDIVKVLILTAKYANRYYQKTNYENILRNIISYSHVKTFLGKRRNIIGLLVDYYDALKELEYYHDNSFFWLQYAIVCDKYGKFGLAQRYIDNAYSFFRDSDTVVPFQIDTQQATLYLHRIEKDEGVDIKECFYKAHELLMIPPISNKDNPVKRLNVFGLYLNKVIKEKVIKIIGASEYQKMCAQAYNKINDYLKGHRDFELGELRAKLLKASSNQS